MSQNEPISTDRQGKTANALQDTTVIDTDVHLHLPLEEIKPYVDTPYDGRIGASDYIGPVPKDGWDRTRNGAFDHDKLLANASSPEALQQSLCEEMQIDYPIINSFPKLTRISDSNFALALMRGYNDHLLDVYLDDHDHFYGIAALASQKPARAAEEVDRIADEDSMVGIYFNNTGPSPPLGDERYDIIYEAAEDHDLPVVYHGAVNGGMVEFPRQNYGLESFLEVHTLFHPWTHMLTLTSMIGQGVPVKFPDLDFVFLEAGLGWVPYTMYRLNKNYSMLRSQAPLLDQTPEKYIRDQFYFASQPIEEPNDPTDLNHTIDQIGTDRLMFATDFPHFDFDHPSEVDNHLQAHYSTEDREQILNQNAAEVFDLAL